MSDKLDLIVQRLESIDDKCDRNVVLLAEHIRRTDLAEHNIELLRKQVQPIEDHVKFIRRLFHLTVVITGLVASVMAILSHLGK